MRMRVETWLSSMRIRWKEVGWVGGVNAILDAVRVYAFNRMEKQLEVVCCEKCSRQRACVCECASWSLILDRSLKFRNWHSQKKIHPCILHPNATRCCSPLLAFKYIKLPTKGTLNALHRLRLLSNSQNVIYYDKFTSPARYGTLHIRNWRDFPCHWIKKTAVPVAGDVSCRCETLIIFFVTV